MDAAVMNGQGHAAGAVAGICDPRNPVLAARAAMEKTEHVLLIGGMAAKAPGRVGDTPILGAGTWADDASCAVSGTGHGEVFIRFAAAQEISARMRLAGQSLEQAARGVVIDVLAPKGGSGGVIAVDKDGGHSLPLDCPGMYRGVVTGAHHFLQMGFADPCAARRRLAQTMRHSLNCRTWP